MKFSFTTLDVFTTERYTGNPLAIVLVPASQSSSLTQKQKQSIASEFNLSETVFLHLPEEGTSPSSRKIDIFTSLAEVPFAGHPTIGTTSYLLSTLSQSISTLITKAGPIPISLSPSSLASASIPHAFHLHSKTHFSPLNNQENQVASIVKGMSFIYVHLPSLEALSSASSSLHTSTYDPSSLDEGWKEGLIATMYYVTQGEDEEGRKRYRTRMFGSREDPGTGSASCGLACFLATQENGEGGKYVFEQGVEMGRRNEIFVEVVKDEGREGIREVMLSGRAVVVMEGVVSV